MRLQLFFISVMFSGLLLFGQEQKSIHQSEWEFYRNNPTSVGRSPLLKKDASGRFDAPLTISKKVYGFHPYWVSDATASGYYYTMLTHLAYFSADVDTGAATTGGFMTTNSWSTSQSVTYAQSYGVKVHLCITMFANHSRVLGTAAYRTNLVNNILTQVNLRSADGAMIDFEAMSASNATNFKSFIKELGDTLAAHGKELAICLPAVDWNGIFPSGFFSQNNSVVTYYFLMAYDYYYRGSSTAGPVAPNTTGTSSYHVWRSVNSYTAAGAPASKLIAGFPYYGYDWPVSSSTRMASATASASSVTFSSANTTIATIAAGDQFFDATYNVPWYRYLNGAQWHQVWYEDSLSISMKYDTINARGLAGTGMWALSYDGSNSDLWGALKDAFASTIAGSYTLLDDFEYSAGRFDKTPTFSGSTAGISTSSSAARAVSQAKNGYAGMKLILKDDAASSSSWTVRFLSGGGSAANNLSVNYDGYYGFWMKTSSAPAGAQVAVTVDDGAATELSPKISVTNDGQWHYYEFSLRGAGWSSFAGGNGIINGPSVSLDAVMFYAANASPDWTIYMDDVYYISASALPVELSLFTCSLRNGLPVLQWETTTETNTAFFSLERKSAKEDWAEIYRVQGAGRSSAPLQYSFTDAKLPAGTYNYRLSTIYNDGTSEIKRTLSVSIGGTLEYRLAQNYPNPFNPSTTITFDVPEKASASLKIYNSLGQMACTLFESEVEQGSYSATWNAAGYPSGIYICELKSGGHTLTKKMLLMK